MTSSFQTASGRGQALGPPITDAASDDPGFGDGAGSVGIFGRCRAGRRAHCRAEAEQHRGGQAGAAKERFTHQATISESHPVGRDVAGVPRLHWPLP